VFVHHPLNRRLNTQDAVVIWSTICSDCNHSRRKISLMAASFAVVAKKLFIGSEMMTELFKGAL